MGTGIEIEVKNYGMWNTDEQQQEGMDGIRALCADLLTEDQTKSTLYHGEDGMDHTSIFVKPGYVQEAVQRINDAGYATDEDAEDEVEA